MYKNVDMSAYTSMKTGGRAKVCYFPESIEELVERVRLLEKGKDKYYILGNMSNVLLPDGDIPFIPVVTTKVNKTIITENNDETVFVYAECGVSFTKLAYEMSKKGYDGLTFAYGIPGSVGGAVFMNAGAYGSEISEVVNYVDCMDAKSGEIIRFSKEECDFSYRHSAFSENGYVILGTELVLKKGNAQEITEKAKQTMQKRIDKQPLEYPSCGSAFKRPCGYFAGELIEKSGLKGYCVGGACVSEKHAGFIINKAGATSQDVKELIHQVQKKVKEGFGVELEPEIRILD